MTILTTFSNGGNLGDYRDTFNSILARLLVLEGAGPPAVPANTVAPAITGTAQEGQVLTVSNGTWSNAPSGYAYQWKRGGTAISGSVNATRTLTAADIGATMTCTVTATNAAGSASATSAGTATVIAATVAVPVSTVAPAVTGTGAVGSTLTTTNGSWSNSPTSFAYAWRRDGVDIAGATASTYAVVSADAGKSITCRVYATNAGGTAGATSNAIAVAAMASISGTPPAAIIGSPYDWQATVTPVGSAIALDAPTVAALSARGISHDGFGRFTSAGVTA